MWLDSGHVLKVEQTRFTDGLNVQHKGIKGSKKTPHLVFCASR